MSNLDPSTNDLAEETADAVHALAVAPHSADSDAWYVARTSGLQRSTDNGETWQDALSNLNLQAALTVASVASAAEVQQGCDLFAGTLGGILRSVDDGVTWQVATLPTPPPYVVDLCISPNYEHDGLVFAATLEDGVFRSWDRGASWAAWNFGLLDLSVYCIVASANYEGDETLFVGVESGIFRSANGGRAWRETAFPMDAAPVLSLAYFTPTNAAPALLAGTESHGLFQSTDDGQTWTAVDFPPEHGAVNQLLTVTNRDQSSIYVITASALFKSADLNQWALLFELREKDETQICAAAVSRNQQAATLLVGTTAGQVQQVALPVRKI